MAISGSREGGELFHATCQAPDGQAAALCGISCAMSEAPAAENPSPEPSAPIPPQAKPPFNELSILFPILAIYTAGYLALMIVDFLFKGALPLPAGMMPIYIALVGAYAADKEVRRWVGRPEPSRNGALFVYLWLIFFMAAFVVRFFRPEYGLPGELAPVTLQVLGIFFGSRASKYVYQRKSAVPAGMAEAVVALIREKGSLSRKQIEEEFEISARSANRLLAELEADGLIRREGDGRGSRYFPGKS